MNVWILERFIPTNETQKHIEELWTDYNNADDETKPVIKMVIGKLENKVEMFPKGYWLGYIGKHNYKDFCQESKDFMRRHKNDLLQTGIRVVKANIKNDSKYWTGYKNPVVNDGVTRYLYATYR